VCHLCYGRNLATGRLVERGEAVASSRRSRSANPARSLTMRTFHIGGAATRASEQSTQDAKSDGFVKHLAINTVRNAKGELIAMNRTGKLAVVDEKAASASDMRLFTEPGWFTRMAPPSSQRHPAGVGSLHLLHPDRSQRRHSLPRHHRRPDPDEQVDEVTGLSQW